MSQHDMDVANQEFASFRVDLNLALKALASRNSGPGGPSPAFAHQEWPDETSGYLKQRNKDNDAWIILWPLDQQIQASAVGTDAYAITRSPALNAYVHGCEYVFQADVANTGGATFADSGLAAKDLKKYAGGAYVALVSGEIPAGHICRTIYDADADCLLLQNPAISLDYITPEMWGAKADSSTDCSAAFTAWLTTCINSGFAGRFGYGFGHYKLNSPVAVTMAAGKSLTIEGCGGDTVIDCSDISYSTGYGQPDVYGISITGTISTDPNNVIRLSNFRMIGGATDLGGLTGLYMDSVGQTILNGLIVTGFPSIGISTYNTGFIEVNGCHCSYNYYAGLAVDGDLTNTVGRGLRIIGGEFNSNGCGAGPWYNPQPPSEYNGIGYGIIGDVQQVYIAGARCVSNDRYGIDCRKGRDLIIDGNYIYDSGLVGIHCPNYNISYSGGVNAKIVNNTVDGNYRASTAFDKSINYCISCGPQDTISASAVAVDQILISGNTLKGVYGQVIYCGGAKLASGLASLKRLIIINNPQIGDSDRDQTTFAAAGTILVGAGNTADPFIDSVIINNNQIVNGGMRVSAGHNANLSGNNIYLTGAGSLYYDSVIDSINSNNIINNNSVYSPALAWLANPFLHNSGSATYTGLSLIREMKGNVVNGDHPAGLWDWIYNNSELSFKWASSVAANDTRPCLDLSFTGATQKGISLSWESSGQDAAAGYLVNSKHLEPIKVDGSGSTTFQGASPYISIPYITSALAGGGSPTVVWKLISATGGFGLAVTPNYDTDLLVDISCRYGGIISTITVTDYGEGVSYIQ